MPLPGGAVSFGAGVTQTQVTLDVLGDFIDEPNETVSVSLANPTGTNASGTSTISGSPAATTILDDDSAGVSVTPTSLTISEPNTTGVFTIALTSQPFSIITNNPTSSDPDYNGAGANPADVNVTNLDDDTAGFIVSAISGDTSEDRLTATFTIRLTSQPTATVTVPISSTDASEGTVSPLNLSFTTLDWNVPQTVTVTGVDDPDLDGDINYSVQMAPTVSSDPFYDNRTPGPVAVVNLDNDVPPVSPIFLPLIVRNSVTAPDLVIDNLTASSSGVILVITNQGNAPVVDAFWVDVYFNPTSTPTVNRRWQDIASRGQVWGIQGAGLPLDPGESLTLTSGDAFYFPQYSSAAPLPVGANVFGLVDSVDFSTTFGAVRENNEANNLFGPVLSTADRSSAAAVQSEIPAPKALPDRE